MAEFDPKAFLGQPDEEVDPSYMLGVAKQVPLGFARGTVNMPASAAPVRGDPDALKQAAESKIPFLGSTISKAIQNNPALVEHYKKTNESLPATTEEYAKPIRKEVGLTQELEPKNFGERLASGAGEGMASGLMFGPQGLAGNLAMSGAGGLGGVLAEEFAEDKDKPLANVAGNLIGSLGMAGVMRLAQGILNMGRQYRTLPGTEIPATKGMLGEEAGLAPEAVRRQLSQEEGMSRGTYGYAAQKIMERQRLARDRALAQEGDNIATEIGGPRATPAEAGETVGQGLKREASGLESAGNAAYERAGEKAAWAHVDVRPSRVVEKALDKDLIVLDEFGNYPASHHAMRVIRKLDQGSGSEPAGALTGMTKSEGPVPISIKDMNQARKALNFIKASRREDNMGLTAIKRSFDRWESDMVNNALFTGDKSVLDDLKEARALWHKYRTMTDANPKKDYTKVISDIVNNQRTPEEVATWLLNVNSHQTAGRASRTAKYIRETFGVDSDEWQHLRQAFVHKAMNPEGAQQGQLATARAIESAISGKGAPLARELFSPEELIRLRKHAQDLRRVNPPAENPPNSGWVNSRYLWSLITGGAGLAGAAGAWHTGDMRLLLLAGVPLVRDAKNAMRAVEATTKTKSSPDAMKRGAILGTLSGSDRIKDVEAP